MIIHPRRHAAPTRDDLLDALDAVNRARGHLEAALRAKNPDPAVLRERWRRAAGAVRVLHAPERRGASEEERYGHA